jgi:hypothetical protein
VTGPRVRKIRCVDWRGQPAHVHITLTDVGDVAIVAPANESFTLDALQAERFDGACNEARAPAADVRERRSS